jgi:tetratricopeptide (TPR) repeat protein
MRMARSTPLFLALAFLNFCVLAGCIDDAGIKTDQKLLEQQQAELDQLKQQIAVLQARRPDYGASAPAAGSCDSAVMREAARKGGERLAAGDFVHAIGYYQDAVTACPDSAKTQLDLARSYEAIGDHAEAVEHYRLAANASGAGADADSVRQARRALARLGG